jgi:2-polyprenyl-3-methyl-5-hydroxy-6-metoxy-1,4-benzoquinol methylase
MSTYDTFPFKEVDPEGYETLKVISDAVNFNNWTFDSIKSFCEGNILEIGSGIGNISSRFIDKGYQLTLSDIRKNYCDFLSQKFPEQAKQNSILNVDLVLPEFDTNYATLFGKFDTVFALNVVEHIKNDSTAVANCYKLLKPGGKLILLMPAFQSLYNSFDKELHHYKRYNRKMMENLFIENKFRIIKSFYFNAGGIPGWIVSGNILNNKIIPAGQMKTFDKLVSVFRIADKLLLNSIGLSVICVGQKS